MCLEKHKCLEHLRPTVSTFHIKKIVRLFPKLKKKNTKNECINRVARECLEMHEFSSRSTNL